MDSGNSFATGVDLERTGRNLSISITGNTGFTNLTDTVALPDETHVDSGTTAHDQRRPAGARPAPVGRHRRYDHRLAGRHDRMDRPDRHAVQHRRERLRQGEHRRRCALIRIIVRRGRRHRRRRTARSSISSRISAARRSGSRSSRTRACRTSSSCWRSPSSSSRTDASAARTITIIAHVRHGVSGIADTER